MSTPDFMPPEVFVRLRLLGMTTGAMYYLQKSHMPTSWSWLLNEWENRQPPDETRVNIGYWNEQARKHGYTD
jgi:hypothetical protein